MHRFREFAFGPWRAVLVLGVTQIIAWGVIYYPPVLTIPLIANAHGWSTTFAMGGFSAALLVAGLVSPRIGRLIDRHGGHRVMAAGSLMGALGLTVLVIADNAIVYLAAWMLLGVAASASLYDAAFATLGRIFGAAARQPITVLTLAGGFASTVSWPVTYLLIKTLDWRGTYLVYASVLVFVAAPLHALLLPRESAHHPTPTRVDGSASHLPPSPPRWMFVAVAAAFAAYAFVPSGLSAHLLAIFNRAGIDAAAVVIIGGCFGPAQVAARLCELFFARNVHPLNVARFAVGLLLAAFIMLAIAGISLWTATIFMVMFGLANGLITIARGTLPLSLFGAVGYGATIGRLAGPFLMMQAIAPMCVAFTIERSSDPAALAVVAGLALVSFASFTMMRRP